MELEQTVATYRADMDRCWGHLLTQLQTGEELFLDCRAERSDFLRFNHAKVRQAGTVEQSSWSLCLRQGGRSAERELRGDHIADSARLIEELAALRLELQGLPEDPHDQADEHPRQECALHAAALPDPIEALAPIFASQGDLVGQWNAGACIRGLRSSRGHDLWHAAESFELDWSAWHDADRGVKARLGGAVFDAPALATALAEQAEQLALQVLPSRRLEPGAYRVWLAPSAVCDLIGMLCWGGFSLKELRSGQSPLRAVHEGTQTLDARVHLSDGRGDGLAAPFDQRCFALPERVDLISAGRSATLLANNRSAAEFAVPVNAGSEVPRSPSMAGGEAAGDPLQVLGDGLYVSDLHYLNYSDRNACRVTGMTRYGCCLVEAGRAVAPIAVMRFDDRITRMLGEGLEAIGSEAQVVPCGSTYGSRSPRFMHVPGLLVEDFQLTL